MWHSIRCTYSRKCVRCDISGIDSSVTGVWHWFMVRTTQPMHCVKWLHCCRIYSCFHILVVFFKYWTVWCSSEWCSAFGWNSFFLDNEFLYFMYVQRFYYWAIYGLDGVKDVGSFHMCTFFCPSSSGEELKCTFLFFGGQQKCVSKPKRNLMRAFEFGCVLQYIRPFWERCRAWFWLMLVHSLWAMSLIRRRKNALQWTILTGIEKYAYDGVKRYFIARSTCGVI